MPELPEVETVVRGLRPILAGSKLKAVQIIDPRLVFPLTVESATHQLLGSTVERIRRRGKYMLWHLNNGLVAIHHLRMSGSYSVTKTMKQAPTAHIRALYVTNRGVAAFRDPRRFGTLEIYAEADGVARLESKLGPEPLSGAFTASTLLDSLKLRTTPIKAALLDQKTVAGLGNIYVDEALFIAGIDPRKKANSISKKRLTRLHSAVVCVLTEAIDRQGSSLRDHQTVQGMAGTMQDQFAVYGRGGEPCERCGRALAVGRIGGRTSTYCRACQR